MLLLSIILLTANKSEKAQGFIAVIAVLIYVTGFAIGLGAGTSLVLFRPSLLHAVTVLLCGYSCLGGDVGDHVDSSAHKSIFTLCVD